MQASRNRHLKDGRKYDALILKGTGKQSQVMRFPSTEDTVKYMLKSYASDAWQVAPLAKALKGATLMESCKNLWQFLYDHVQYRLDPDGVELVRTPAATWRDRVHGVDCDCYSYFIACVLHNWGDEFYFRRADYGNGGFQHVYVAVPDGKKIIIIDPVLDGFNQEHPYIKKSDMSNTLARLDGIYGYDLGKTKVGKLLQKVARTGKNVIQAAGKAIKFVALTINPATIGIRNGYLLGMKMNIFNVAKRIRFGYLTEAEALRIGWKAADFAKLKQTRERMEKAYEAVGGKKENLKKAILSGKGNKDLKVKPDAPQAVEEYQDELEFQILAIPSTTPPNSVLKLTPIPTSQLNGLSGVGALGCTCGLNGLGAEPATSAALIALASSGIALVSKALDVIPFPNKSDVQPEPNEYDSTVPQQTFDGGSDGSGSKDDKKSPLPWILGGAAVLGIGYYFYQEGQQPAKKKSEGRQNSGK